MAPSEIAKRMVWVPADVEVFAATEQSDAVTELDGD